MDDAIVRSLQPRRTRPRDAPRDPTRVDKLLTVGEVADRLQVSKQTVYNWVYAHHLPHRRLGPSGRTIRFIEEDIASYVAERRR